jgi:hypothetical protein
MARQPFFLLLLPVFFVVHGYREHLGFVPGGDALLLALAYLGVALVLAGLGWLLYRDRIKASVLAFGLLAAQFFFGSVHDLLKDGFPGSFLTRYSFLLPFGLGLVATLAVWLKKTRRPLQRLSAYLNLLFILLLFSEAALLLLHRSPAEVVREEELKPCADCATPDIYLVVLDEYAGRTALKEQFGYDNSVFEGQLEQRGFHVVDESRSNYNFTPYSVASLLNMNYPVLDMKAGNPGNIHHCYNLIGNSSVVGFLQKQGYRFYNHSIFDFREAPAFRRNGFLPSGTRFITSQTLLSRVESDLRADLLTGKLKLNALLKPVTYEHLHNNRAILSKTEELAAQRLPSPKLVYAHLMMPHYPYYFDSSGRELPFEELTSEGSHNKSNYVQYLRYCNGRILQLVDRIMKNSPAPPIIILVSDHGFRSYRQQQDRSLYFMNLSAIYLPSKNYSRFYNGLSNVNLFRVILNQQFGQKLELRKDSTVFLWKE